MMEGFLQVDGIEGECKDHRHKRWIDVFGVSWGATQEVVPKPDGSIGPGSAEVQAFRFSQVYNRASIGLFQACATGREIPTMVFEGVLPHGDAQVIFLRATFSDCLVTKIETASADEVINEDVEIVFRKVQLDSQEKPV
jgi:type VI secretion system secreted protein Hcp